MKVKQGREGECGQSLREQPAGCLQVQTLRSRAIWEGVGGRSAGEPASWDSEDFPRGGGRGEDKGHKPASLLRTELGWGRGVSTEPGARAGGCGAQQ